MLALGACTFDTSVLSSAGDAGEPSSLPDAAELVVDAMESPACESLGTQSQPFTILSQINSYPAGRYYFFLSENLFEGEVGIDEDGDAWLMTLNYLHADGTNPDLTVYSDRAPLLSGEPLGSNEAATQFWGHVSNALFAGLGADEMRFFARTSFHDRVMHFRSSHANTLAYFASGKGSALGLGDDFTAYSDHTSELPANQNNGFSNQGNAAQTNFPFYKVGDNHWGIRGRGFRWEVDDFSSREQPSTEHRSWVRSSAICGDGIREGQEACDDGNLIAGDGCGCCVKEGL